MRKKLASIMPIMAVLLTAACSDASEEGDRESVLLGRDPIVQQALFDQLMVDPDLAFQNEGNAALTIGFDRSIPPLATSPELAISIRDEARMVLLEGGPIPMLPDPRESAEAMSFSGAVSAQHMARLVSFAEPCAEGLSYSAAWAARLPEHAAIIPRGAVMEAAGKDSRDCRLRSISYRTPATPVDAAQFHYTLAKRAKLAPRLYASPDGAQSIITRFEGTGLAVHARDLGNGLTSVELVSLETRAR